MIVKFQLNRTRIVQTTRNFELFEKKQKQTKIIFYNHFWQRVDAILEDVSVAEVIVYC